MTIIDEFIRVCKEKGDKAAFVFKGKQISYNTLLSDVYRTIEMMKVSGMKPQDKALVFVRPSYELYLLLFAGLYYGVNLMVTDSYKSPKGIQKLMRDEAVSYVFCDKLTALLKPLIGSRQKWIDMTDYSKYSGKAPDVKTDVEATVLTTYTSGTTGSPKPIRRSLEDLRRQVKVVINNIDICADDIVFSKLPIYTLFVVFSGLTCVISKRIQKEELKGCGVTAVLAPIAELLEIKETLDFIDKVSLGGATLYPREIDTLNAIFPKAEIGYVYGSSECVLIAKTDLRYFEKEYAFHKEISGIAVSIVNPDKNGIGQICVCADVVLSDSKKEVSNDIGYIDDKGLHIVGRRNFSAEGQYNYVLDRKILAMHPEIKRGFSLVYKDKLYFCYEGKKIKAEDDVTYVHFLRLPMDYKHKTKLNYQKALKKIKNVQK